MKMLFLLLLCLIPATHQQTLQQKFQTLIEWSQRSPLIELNEVHQFQTYVRSEPRNYSTILLLAALAPQFGCEQCNEVKEEFDAVAYSYATAADKEAQFAKKPVFFILVDLQEETLEIFTSLRVNSPLNMIHFPAKGDPKRADHMDFQSFGADAFAFSSWIKERTGAKIQIKRPVNYYAMLALPVSIAFGCAFLFLVFHQRSALLQFITNVRAISGIFTLCILFVFLSGQMWNQIRKPPYMRARASDLIGKYIYPNMDMQFVSETYIVLAFYAAISIGFIIMVEAVGKPKTSRALRRQRRDRLLLILVMAIFGLAVVIVVFSIFISIFRKKYSDYPYRLLFS